MKFGFLIAAAICGLAISSLVFSAEPVPADDAEACKQYIKKHENEKSYDLGAIAQSACAQARYRKSITKYVKCVDEFFPQLNGGDAPKAVMDRCVFGGNMIDETLRPKIVACANALKAAEISKANLFAVESCAQNAELLNNTAEVVGCAVKVKAVFDASLKQPRPELGYLLKMTVVDDCSQPPLRKRMDETLDCAKEALAINGVQPANAYFQCQLPQVKSARKDYISCLKQYFDKPKIPDGVGAPGSMMTVSSIEPPCYSKAARAKMPSIVGCYEHLTALMKDTKEFNPQLEYGYYYFLTSCQLEPFRTQYEAIGKCMKNAIVQGSNPRSSLYDIGTRCASGLVTESKQNEEGDTKSVPEKLRQKKPAFLANPGAESK